MEYIAITKELEIVYRTCSKIEIDKCPYRVYYE